jgi:electron transport complex protein RnfB
MNKIYKKLRKHLNAMPVGYPLTWSGVEYKILMKIFSPQHAETALFLDNRFRSASEIYSRMEEKKLSPEDLEKRLNDMASAGCILSKIDRSEKKFALVPYVVGMYEFQTDSMTRESYENTLKYFKEGYAIDFLTTAVPQMRVVPIEKSITSETRVNTYDEIRKIIINTNGGISVTDCVCKKGQMLKGEPCQQSDSNEVCIGLNEYNDIFQQEGWGRSISKDEALELIAQAEKNGLIIQTANEKNPQFICACCSCCCGILAMMKAFPRPRDFVATNYFAEIDGDLCTGCSLCVKRCSLDAIEIIKKEAIIKKERCIGCGLCVPSCKKGAISLQKTDIDVVPPDDTEDLYEKIRIRKRSKIIRIFNLLKAVFGIPLKKN